MKHQNLDQIMQNAEVIPLGQGVTRMSRSERLERWATALESHGGALNALRQIEYLSPEDRRAYRGANTPMTVAFNDTALREEGLPSDRLGDAMDFFEMTTEDAHRLLCDCHYLGTMTGPRLASRIRHHARAGERGGIWKRAMNFVMGRGF